ncbi:MAG: MaoC family dehydratase [Deltaproteobacteria bacterium]|jgi:3-hydroxybutyryl-CoA dehydratase|nr:MaoC family dehydratase [Deltaproteobacteria bacterium]
MPKFEDITIGQVAQKTTAITKEMIREFALVTGDDNPVHLDETFAATGSFFKRCVAHGMISASLIASLLGSELPGHGTIYVSQNFEFKAPVFPGDKVTVHLQVLEKDEKSKKIKLQTTVTNQDGILVIDGQCWVMQRLPKITSRPS